MTDTQHAKALHLLYSQLKKARIDLDHAERRQNNWDEREPGAENSHPGVDHRRGAEGGCR